MKKIVQWGASILLFLGLASCHPKEFQVGGVEQFRVSKLTFKDATIQASVRCYNPNGYRAKLIQFKSAILLGDQPAGDASSDSSVWLPAKDSFLLPITMTVKMGPAFNALREWATNPGSTLPLRFQGEAVIKKGVFTIKKKFDQVPEK